ncbi:MAG TPA: ParB/RepB/Spo0J family partition protein [Tepidisphaeraceae bacterium]|jgi:ParB family chromosome partitioning protein|nr:ParB/RepB/Spo0J family partition protein [Tepidisphaeraceae bacterium]
MSKMKSRLGRGLSSLISVNEEPATTAAPPAVELEKKAAENPVGQDRTDAAPATVPVDAVVPNPHQPRRSFPEASLIELAASLKANGLIQPILVRRQGDQYELVAGERRLRAAKLAGLKEIPAIIRDVDGLTQAQLALVENIQREDLNPIDRANGYRTLMNQLGLTQAELAGRLGEDRSGIANFTRLLDLQKDVQQMIGDGRLTLGHGKVLAGVSDAGEQLRLAELAVAQGLSVRNLERLVQDPTATTASTKSKSDSPHLNDLERSVARQLGLKVQIRTSGSKGRGRITMHYGSLDQFDELMTRLGVDVEP